VAFALEAAADDYQLATVVREYTAAKHWAAYLAIDRAVEAWDGPTNFRTMDGNAAMSWTHNFFVYEEDDSDVAKREFHLVPWDMDGAFPFETPPDQPVGARPDYDAPVCGPSEQQAGRANGNGCIICRPYTSTGGLSQSRPPSCFLLNRAFFGRGLRGHYIKAATDALSGPLRTCNIKSKLNRWKASIASAVAEDTRAGLWPGTQYTDAGYSFTDHFNYMRDEVVPAQIKRYFDSVACGEGGSRYTPEQWGELYGAPVGEMLDIDDFETGRWHQAPGAGGGDSTLGIIIGIVAGIVVVLVLGTVATYCWLRSRQPSGVLATTKPATATCATISTASAASASPS